jgi:hypothetical protein
VACVEFAAFPVVSAREIMSVVINSGGFDGGGGEVGSSSHDAKNRTAQRQAAMKDLLLFSLSGFMVSPIV